MRPLKTSPLTELNDKSDKSGAFYKHSNTQYILVANPAIMGYSSFSLIKVECFAKVSTYPRELKKTMNKNEVV